MEDLSKDTEDSDNIIFVLVYLAAFGMTVLFGGLMTAIGYGIYKLVEFCMGS